MDFFIFDFERALNCSKVIALIGVVIAFNENGNHHLHFHLQLRFRYHFRD
jgi:hypothetical protein